jgi:hypothetical protein
MPALPLGVAVGRSVLAYHATVSGGGLDPFYWAASLGDASGRWHRVIGLERSFQVATIPLARLPHVSIKGGLAYSLDEPYRHRTRAYLSLSFRP